MRRACRAWSAGGVGLSPLVAVMLTGLAAIVAAIGASPGPTHLIALLALKIRGLPGVG